MRDNIFAASEQLVKALTEKKMTAATAESCTGGLICSALTSVPGSSEAILGGIVSYAVSVKKNVLGVSQDTLDSFGVVSEKCAVEMAEGAKRITGADIAVSVTGIAGPGGGTKTTPVGTVCFGIAHLENRRAYTVRFDPALGRDGIRRAAVMFAIERLISEVCDN